MNISQVTVFGGTGFVGGCIVEQLLAAKIPVKIAVRHPQAGRWSESDGVSLVTADIRDRSAVETAIEGSGAVINAVSLYVERGRDSFESVHVQGARVVAEEAARANVQRLIYLSGLGTDPNSPSAYVRARTEGETQVRKSFNQATILSPSVVFGPGDSFLNSLSRITRLSPILPLFGTGETRLQPVFVGDVAKAAVRALSDPNAAGQLYELGGPEVYSYRSIVKLVLDHFTRRRLLIPTPFKVWELEAALLSILPNPPITRDQVILMETDSVVSSDALTLTDLGIDATSLESQLTNSLR